MNQTMTMHEQVSALADGQLEGEALAQVVALAGHDQAVRAAWDRYHLIGDVLRSGRHEPSCDTSAFMARLQQRLASEAPVPVPMLASQPEEVPLARHLEAANEPVFRWKLMAGAASMAAAAAIGWNWVGQGPAAAVGAQLAQVQAAPTVLAVSSAREAPAALTTVAVGSGGSGPVMLRNARLDAMLAAHQQASGGLQMPSGFLRSATFEGAAR